MKIVYISHGSFTHVRPYIDYFKRCGHDIYLFKLAPGPDYGVKAFDLSIGSKYDSSAAKVKYLISAWRARKLLRKIKPDIVHTHYATSGGLAGLICGFKPTVVTAHGSDVTTGIKSPVWRPLLKRIFKQAAFVNVVSEDLKGMVLDLGIPEAKTHVLTLGVDTNKFAFSPKKVYAPGRPLRMVNTRRLESVYDHPTIIRGLQILHNQGQDFKMTFVGNGELEGELKQLAAEKGLSEKINFVGGCDNTQMHGYLADNDIYLSASLWDGTSLCLLEAMACGCFPIVSEIPANSSWLEDGKTGLLHKVANPEQLAECIMTYTRNAHKFSDVLDKNRRRVEQFGDRITNMGKLELIYRNLLDV